MKEDIDYDVVIIGAGFSGLSSAHTLLSSNKDLRVLIVEGRDRIGGRTSTEKIGEIDVDMGGQWIDKEHRYLWKLIKKFSVETNKEFIRGKELLEVDEKIYCMSEGDNDTPYAKCKFYLNKIHNMANQLNLKRIDNDEWNNQEKEWDKTSLKEWLETQEKKGGDKMGAKIFKSLLESFNCTSAENISLLEILWESKLSGGIENHLMFNQKWDWWTIRGGTTKLAEKLHSFIKNFKNSEIILSHTVTKISQTTNSVTLVINNDNKTIKANYCICTVPMNLYSSIEWEPKLPRKMAEISRNSPMGKVIKYVLLFEKPFWRDDGYSCGFSVDGPICTWLESCDESIQRFSIIIFVVGDHCDKLLESEKEERKKKILGHLEKFLGKKVHENKFFGESAWTEDKFCLGGYNCVTKPGYITSQSCLYEPFKSVYFAGTEYAEDSVGYIDGAIESGFTNAQSVLKMIKKHK